MAILDIRNGGFELVELAPGTNLHYVQEKTDATIVIPECVRLGEAATL